MRPTVLLRGYVSEQPGQSGHMHNNNKNNNNNKCSDVRAKETLKRNTNWLKRQDVLHCDN